MLRRVVGYQNKSILSKASGGYTWALCTLPGVGEDETELKLADWKITPPDGGLESDYSVQMFTFDQYGQIDKDYVYLDDNTAGTYGVDSGWYDTESVKGWSPEPTGDDLIPYGSGVQIASADCGATVTFAGQVAGARTFKVFAKDEGGYTWTGNTSPTKITMKDFSITPPAGGLESDYSVQVFTFSDDGQIDKDYVYLDDNTAGTYGVDPGWYDTESVKGWSPESVGDDEIEAGQMFQIASADCGGQITVPNPME